jgi:hypothetical protein
MGYEINNLYRASYLELPKNKSRGRISREVEGVFTVLRAIILLRIAFIYFDILPEGVEKAISSLSYPLVAPFYLLIGTTPGSGNFDWIALFSIAIYSILGFIIVRVVRSSIVSAPAEEVVE